MNDPAVILKYAAILAALWGWFSLVSKRLKVPPPLIPVFVVSSLGGALYICGLLGILKPGTWFIFLLGLAAFCLHFYRVVIKKNPAENKSDGSTIVFFIFFFFMTVMAILHAEGRFWMHDDFSHWGFIVKYLTMMHHFPASDSTILFQDYPPGSALIQYFFCSILGYREGFVYIGQHVLLLALGMTFYVRVQWQRIPRGYVIGAHLYFLLLFLYPILPLGSWIKFTLGMLLGLWLFLMIRLKKSEVSIPSLLTITLILPLYYISLCAMGPVMQSLWVDGLLGLFMGAAIWIYFSSKESMPRTLLRILPLLFLLPLIKKSGILFAMVVSTVILVDFYILPNLKRFVSFSWKKRMNTAVILPLIFFLTPFIAKISWDIHVRCRHLGTTFESKQEKSISPFHFLSGNLSQRDRQIISNFKTAVGNTNLININYQKCPPVSRPVKSLSRFLNGLVAGQEGVSPRISGWTVFLGSVFLWGILLFIHRKNGSWKSVSTGYIILLSGFFIYAVGLLTLYLFSFSDWEAVRLAAYVRYMQSYVIGLFWVQMGFLIRGMSSRDRIITWTSAGIIFTITLMMFSMAPRCAREIKPKKPHRPQVRVHELLRKIPEIPKNARVYPVWQNSAGTEIHVLRYELMPARVSGNYSFGKKYDPKRNRAADISLSKWVEELRHYDFVLIGNADDYFWDTYGSIFGGDKTRRKYGLYRIHKLAKTVRLVPHHH